MEYGEVNVDEIISQLNYTEHEHSVLAASEQQDLEINQTLEKRFEILNAFVWAGGNFIVYGKYVYCKMGLKGHGEQLLDAQAAYEKMAGKRSGMTGIKYIVATKGDALSFEGSRPSMQVVKTKKDIRMDPGMRAASTLGKD